MIKSAILSDLAPTHLEAINDEPTSKMIALCHLDNIKARSEFTTDEFSNEDFLSIQCELDAIRKQIKN